MYHGKKWHRGFCLLLNLELLELTRLLLRTIIFCTFAMTGRIAARFLGNWRLEELRACYTTAPYQCCTDQQRNQQIGNAPVHLSLHSIRISAQMVTGRIFISTSRNVRQKLLDRTSALRPGLSRFCPRASTRRMAIMY